MCFGTFDRLHPGHISYFCQAKELGEEVVVVVARDATVLDVKGQLPSMNEQDRLQAVAAHEIVTSAHLGNPYDSFQIIDDLKPDILLLGYDQRAFTESLKERLAERGIHVHIMRAKPYRSDVYKSSLLRAPSSPVVYEDDGDQLPL
mgnify:CR=1 FL=1